MKLALKILLSWIIVFWNVENFFDYRQPSTISEKNWTAGRFYAKARGIGKVILSLADSAGTPPKIIGLAEIDSPATLKAIVGSSVLYPFHYHYIHFESPDPRGIDCALLYRDCMPMETRSIPLTLDGQILPTRSLLLVKFEDLTVLVCHLPSKRGGSAIAQRRRDRAMEMMDSIAAQCPGRLLVMGDFNEERRPDDRLLSLTEITTPQKTGSIKFQGRWEKIDRCLANDTSGIRLKIADLDMLSEQDTRYGGAKPLRTYSGPRYLGGLSDHYPIVIYLDYP